MGGLEQRLDESVLGNPGGCGRARLARIMRFSLGCAKH